MTADIPFYVELARKAEGPLVELAIVNGRVAIPIAQATGRIASSTGRVLGCVCVGGKMTPEDNSEILAAALIIPGWRT